MIELIFATVLVCSALHTNAAGVTDDASAVKCFDTVAPCVRAKVTAESSDKEKTEALKQCFSEGGYTLPQNERI